MNGPTRPLGGHPLLERLRGARAGSAPSARPGAAVALAVGLAVAGCEGQPGVGPGAEASEAPPSAFVGATLLDGTGAEPVADAVLVVRDGRVECAGSPGDCPVPGDAEEVRLDGRWIVPGLVDAHVHFGQTGWADGRPDGLDVTADHPFARVVARQKGEVATTYRSYLCAGITAVYDVGGFPWTWDLRPHARAGPGIPGPDGLLPPHVAAAGPLLTWVEPRLSLPAEHTMAQVEDVEGARENARYMDAFASDAVKLWYLAVPEDDRERIDGWVRALGEETGARGLPLIVHATSLREAKVALEAGARLLVHSVTDREVDDEFLELMGEGGAMYTPTLIVGENWGELYNHAALGEAPELDDPNGCVDPETREKIRSTSEYRDHPAVRDLTAEEVEARRTGAREGRERMAANLRRVHEAGIPVAVGTDAGNPLTLHGPSIYAELERMQEAGIAPSDLLVMATRNGAKAMGREDDLGTLEPGKVADFLVLEGDPLADIAHVRFLSHVARAGRILPVEELSFGGER